MRLVEQHKCQDDNGRQYTVNVFQEFINVSSFDSPNAEIPGMKRLRLSTGESVNYVDENTFLVVASGTTIRKMLQ